MALATDKQALTSELDRAREQFTAYTSALRRDLHVGTRLKAKVAANPVAWFGGAAITGLLISRITRAPRKVVVKTPALPKGQAANAGKAAFGLTLLKFGLDFAKPALLAWLRKTILAEKPGRSQTQ